MALDQARLLAAIDAGRERSYGTDEQSDLGSKRAAALQAYFGHNVNPAPQGRSQVVDRTVYETVSKMMPSLVRIFSSSADEICKLTPIGPDDEPAADQATAVLNYVVRERNQWEQICHDWMLDAMLLCNGYCMAYWDETEKVIRERYDGQSEDQLAALLQDKGTRVLQHSSIVDAETTEQMQQAWAVSVQQARAQGMPMPPRPKPATLHDVVIERRENDGKVCIQVLPPEQCYVSIDTPNWLLDECPYFEFRQEMTISDLRAMGLEVPDEISDDDTPDTENESLVRDRFGESDAFDDQGKGAMRRVWARMIWVRADVEDDGQARLYYVIAVGRTILYSEPASRIPVASMTPQPLPHRHIGMSVAETIKDLQDVKTAITRGGLDNLYLANAGRHVISSRVSLEDFLDGRPGGVVRMLDDSMPGDGHIMPLTHPVVFDQVIGSLQYFDQISQNRSGASNYFSGTDANAINKTASGTIALQNMASMRIEHLARMMAPAVEQLFSIVLEVISKHQNKPLTIKLTGEWTTVDPQAWRTKRDVRISVGVGAGNKDAMMAHLQGVLGTQVQVGLPLGLCMRENIHATNAEILKLAGFSNTEKFWPDPRQLPPPQPQMSPEQIKAQAEAQKVQFQAQQDAQKFQAEQQLREREMAMQAELDRQREEMQARQKTLEQEMEAQIERMRIESNERIAAEKAAIEKYKADLQASVAIQSAQTTSQTTLEGVRLSKASDGIVDELRNALQVLQAEVASPAEIVRGPDGRAVAVKRNGRERKIVRGPDGRAIGVQ